MNIANIGGQLVSYDNKHKVLESYTAAGIVDAHDWANEQIAKGAVLVIYAPFSYAIAAKEERAYPS